MKGVSDEALDRARDLIEGRWGQLVAQIRRDPAVAEMVNGLLPDKVERPSRTVARMHPQEVKMLMLLSHLAIGEALIRASEEDREGDDHG